jgi:hypothetical protein
MRQAILPLFVAAAMATAVAAAQTTPTDQPSSSSQAPQTSSSDARGAQSNRANDARSLPSQQSQRGRATHKSSSDSQGPQMRSSDTQQPSESNRANDARSLPSQQGEGRSDPQQRSAQATETRPDAKYPHPSGQDSQPDNSSHTTRLATGDSKTGTGTADNRGPKTSDQSRPVRKLSERKTYTGSSGSKADPSTACSTARRTQDGGVDCGTSGNGATEGNTVTKPH